MVCYKDHGETGGMDFEEREDYEHLQLGCLLLWPEWPIGFQGMHAGLEN